MQWQINGGNLQLKVKKMSARLQETGEWSTKFVRGLPGAYKAFWFWLKSNCDHGGVWDVDIDLARLITGFPEINQAEAERFFEPKILIVCNGDKWLLIDFCEEQFKTRELNPANTYHRGAIRILEKIDAFNKEIYFLKPEYKEKTKGLDSGLEATKEKEKIIYKEKDNIELVFNEEETKVVPLFEEIQKNEEIKKEPVKSFVTPLVEAFRDFKEMRKLIKKPLTERASAMIHSKLTLLAGDDVKLKIAILEQSVLNCNQSVWPLRAPEVYSTSEKPAAPIATRTPRKQA